MPDRACQVKAPKVTTVAAVEVATRRAFKTGRGNKINEPGQKAPNRAASTAQDWRDHVAQTPAVEELVGVIKVHVERDRGTGRGRGQGKAMQWSQTARPLPTTIIRVAAMSRQPVLALMAQQSTTTPINRGHFASHELDLVTVTRRVAVDAVTREAVADVALRARHATPV